MTKTAFHFLCLLILSGMAYLDQASGQDLIYSQLPKPLQFFPRESDDSATISISGLVPITKFDSIYVIIVKNGEPIYRQAKKLFFVGSRAPFNITLRIKAELSEHTFIVGIKNSILDSIVTIRDSIISGDVYFIAGQSNSIFGSPSETYKSEYIRTFGLNWSREPGDTSWAVATANTYGGGPEIGGWGLRLARKIQESQGIPVAIINGGVGGTIIEYHQRNDADPLDMRTIYASMLYRAQRSGLASAAKAMFWYQGESNSIDNYYNNFKNLYDDWLTDYPNLQKVYVLQFRPGCIVSENAPLRELLRSLSDSLPNIVTHSTMGLPYHDGCHFTLDGYHELGDQLFHLVSRDFYHSTDTIGINSPNMLKAFFANPEHDVIGLLFETHGADIVIPNDTIVSSIHASIRDYLYIGTDTGTVSDIIASKDTLWIKLMKPADTNYVSYLPDKNYNNTETTYEGPWLANSRGLGAFSFWRVPILDSINAKPSFNDTTNSGFQLYPNPSYSSVTIQFTIIKQTHVRIAIFDEVGRKIIRPVDEIREAGTYTIGLDTRQLGATCATVRLELDGHISDKQLIIVH